MSSLRPALPADLPGIWAVRYAVTENTLAPGRISDAEVLDYIEGQGRGWVVEVDGCIEGFAMGHARTGQVWALFVRPQAQGRGYGSLLHQALMAWFSTQPVASLWLSTGSHTRARRFYEKLGWQCTGPYGEHEVRYERSNSG